MIVAAGGDLIKGLKKEKTTQVRLPSWGEIAKSCQELSLAKDKDRGFAGTSIQSLDKGPKIAGRQTPKTHDCKADVSREENNLSKSKRDCPTDLLATDLAQIQACDYKADFSGEKMLLKI